jgi:hypothetical protein
MLSLDLLELLRSWWRAGREKGVMLPGDWLFSSRRGEPLCFLSRAGACGR